MNKAQKEALKRWKDLCETIQTMTVLEAEEQPLAKQARINMLRKNYADFVRYYFPHYCKDKTTGELIESAKFHISAANYLKSHNSCRAVFQWARGHAKSTHMDIMIPLWLKCQEEKQINVMVLVGKSENSANTLLGDIQAELQYNQRYIDGFGTQYANGSWQTGEFVTIDETAFFALGRGQSPRGLRYRNHRPDYIVIDDLDDDELCNNEARVNKMTDWVKEALFGAMGADGGRFIMVGNLISKNSVLANISNIDGVKVSRVNVYDKNGNPSWAALWKPEKIKEAEKFMGYRAFQKEYMNNPIVEGAVFKANWIQYKKPLPLNKYAEMVLYIDPSFKPTTKNDYKAAKLWGKTTDGELHCLDCFCRQTTIVEMVRWLYDLYEKLQQQNAACTFYMEANFMQDIILDEFFTEGKARGYQLPIIPDRRKKPDKFQRIEAISPLWERGFVFYNIQKQNDKDFEAALQQTLSFEKGSSTHDDSPDADEGAIYILQKRSRTEAFDPIVKPIKNSKYQW